MSTYNVDLIADPDQLTRTDLHGELKLNYMNYSLIPVTIAVRNLSSTDSKVASPKSTGPLLPTIDVPRRPSKRSAATPAEGTRQIGNWSPVSQGFATLNADIDILDPLGQRFLSLTPSDDVQVT